MRKLILVLMALLFLSCGYEPRTIRAINYTDHYIVCESGRIIGAKSSKDILVTDMESLEDKYDCEYTEDYLGGNKRFHIHGRKNEIRWAKD